MKTLRPAVLRLSQLFGCLLILSESVMGQPAYKLKQMQREDLSRGVVAVRRDPQTVAVSWRYLSSDPMQTTFHIYRNGKKILVLAGKSAPKIIREDKLNKLL